MEFGLSHEQTLLRDSLTQFLTDRAPLARVRRFDLSPGEDSTSGRHLISVRLD